MRSIHSTHTGVDLLTDCRAAELTSAILNSAFHLPGARHDLPLSAEAAATRRFQGMIPLVWVLEMAPSQHLTISVGSGVILGLLTRSWVAGISCCLVGVLVDLDHFIDFWLNRGLSLDIREFFEFNYYGSSQKFFDLLHGYELIPLLWLLTSLAGWTNAGLGLTLGYAIHLLSDQFFNNHLNRWTYFLTYRLYHGFDAGKIVLRRPLQAPDLSKSHPDD